MQKKSYFITSLWFEVRRFVVHICGEKMIFFRAKYCGKNLKKKLIFDVPLWSPIQNLSLLYVACIFHFPKVLFYYFFQFLSIFRNFLSRTECHWRKHTSKLNNMCVTATWSAAGACADIHRTYTVLAVHTIPMVVVK